MGFGQHTLKMLPKLLTAGRGAPELPMEEVDGPSIFAAMVWAGPEAAERSGPDWDDAKLPSVVAYLRGNKYLELPPEWKAVFPKSLALPFRASAGSHGTQ